MREEYKDFKKGDLLSYSLLKKIDLEMLPHLKTITAAQHRPSSHR